MTGHVCRDVKVHMNVQLSATLYNSFRERLSESVHHFSIFVTFIESRLQRQAKEAMAVSILQVWPDVVRQHAVQISLLEVYCSLFLAAWIALARTALVYGPKSCPLF